MKDALHYSSLTQWQPNDTTPEIDTLITALENGQVLYFPQLPFALETYEHTLISPQFSDGKSKNISFNAHTQTLQGFLGDAATRTRMQQLLQRYAALSTRLVKQVFPAYREKLMLGRTSFRPIEIADRRASSYRKDDTRLHVDAFPASPNQGNRILRVFSNIHLQQKPRQWRVGEPFSEVARQFFPNISAPLPGSAKLLQLLHITRGLRTPYDHYMLKIHDRMKGDQHYQQRVLAQDIAFPTQTTWMVFTDQVSHAALSGQHVLEQTFYLPVNAMANPEKSPLRILEKLAGQTLIRIC